MGQHEQQSCLSEEYQGDRESHESVVGSHHRKFSHIGTFCREFSQFRIPCTDEPVYVETRQTQHQRYQKIHHSPAAEIQTAYVVNYQTRIREIDYQLVHAVVHFIIYEIYLSQKPSREKYGEQNEIFCVHILFILLKKRATALHQVAVL